LLFISSVSLSLSHVISLALSLSIHNARRTRATDADNGKHGHNRFVENAPCTRQAANRCVVSEHLLFICSVSVSLSHVISCSLSLSILNTRRTRATDAHTGKHTPFFLTNKATAWCQACSCAGIKHATAHIKRNGDLPKFKNMRTLNTQCNTREQDNPAKNQNPEVSSPVYTLKHMATMLCGTCLYSHE
jgi:hypothetical protein